MKSFVKTYALLFIPIFILNIISLLNMVNAPLISSSYNNALVKEFIWIIIGYISLFIILKINIKKLFDYSKYLYVFSLLLLILVLIVGKEINGAKCWLNIFEFSFQPSELCNISLSLYLFSLAKSAQIKSFKDELKLVLKLLIVTLIPSILVFLEPDTGAIINYFIIFLIVFLAKKLNKKWYIFSFITLLLFIITFIIIYIFYKDLLLSIIGTSLFYRIDRIINWTNGTSYQLENALTTIGSASFFRWGFNKIQLYIPEAPTDFIFAFSIGNYGLICALLILLSFITLDLFLINKNKNQYKMFVSTYIGIFLFHQIYNIFMNLGLLPIMGIPLPFLSYGGSNIIINYIYIGIIVNIFNRG